jgi:hypothetical protein
MRHGRGQCQGTEPEHEVCAVWVFLNLRLIVCGWPFSKKYRNKGGNDSFTPPGMVDT